MLSPTDVHSCWEDMSYISADLNLLDFCWSFSFLKFQPKLMSVCVFKAKSSQFLHYKKKGEQ